MMCICTLSMALCQPGTVGSSSDMQDLYFDLVYAGLNH